MRRIIALFALVAAAASLGCPGKPPAQPTQGGAEQPKATPKLDGTWQAVRIEAEDGTSGNDMASVTRLTIAGEKLKVTLGAANIDGFITTDTTRNPKTFDAQGSSKEGAKLDWSGIYEFEGDTLKLCIGEPGARPKEFKSNPATLWVLKRVK
jgi:uncharacterized protein (TIGR03067 family)